MSERLKKARKIHAELMGDEYVKTANALQESGNFGGAFSRLSQEAVFHDIWGRDDLDWRTRSIATIAMLVVLKLPEQLKNHVRIGIQNGLTAKEIEALILHTSAYAGFPAAAAANGAAQEELSRMGLL